MKVIDFSAGVPSGRAVKGSGYAGAVLYISPPREPWMKGKMISRGEVADYEAAGLDLAFVWQHGGAYDPDSMRGYAGGMADARAAQKVLEDLGRAGWPVFFAVDFDISLAQWNSTAVEYFRAAGEVLGVDRVGIYGHSRVIAWAAEDGVVADLGGGKVLSWQTPAWSHGVRAPEAVLYQGRANVPGPDGIQIDVNDVLHDYWGQAAVSSARRGKSVPRVQVRVDEYVWLNKHFTRGRGGQKIRRITRHHMGGIGNAHDCYRWWQTRRASAHFAVQGNHVGQLVRVEDTAWGNNDSSNASSVIIEHSNSGGPEQDWPIADDTLMRGAQLAAELCAVLELGRPEYGVNIDDHCDHSATACPYHLANGGKYHQLWMNEAQRWYDLITQPEEDSFMPALNDDEQRELLRLARKLDHEIADPFDSRYDLERLRRGEIGPGEVFADTAIGYALEADRKLEDMHANMLPFIAEMLSDILVSLQKIVSVKVGGRDE
ncbi:glycoside hydrolase domain-containing protein [Corynebacterium aurimucosum]